MGRQGRGMITLGGGQWALLHSGPSPVMKSAISLPEAPAYFFREGKWGDRGAPQGGHLVEKSAISLPDWAGPWGPLVKKSQISLPDALPGVPLFFSGGWVCVAAKRSKRPCFVILRYRLFLSLRRRSPNMADYPPASGERVLGLKPS